MGQTAHRLDPGTEALRVLLSKLERAAETLRAVLNVLTATSLKCLREHADPERFERYGQRIEDQRLPQGKEARKEYLKTVGADDKRFLVKIDAPYALQSLNELAEVEILRNSESSSTSRSTERSGFLTQKRCLKPPTASNSPTKRRLTTVPSEDELGWLQSASRGELRRRAAASDQKRPHESGHRHQRKTAS